MNAEEVREKIAECGSLVAAIEELRGRPRTLRRYETPDLSAVEAWLAEHDILAPTDDDEPFEPLFKRKLLRRLKLPRRRQIGHARL
jgi:hypothetical protein